MTKIPCHLMGNIFPLISLGERARSSQIMRNKWSTTPGQTHVLLLYVKGPAQL